MTGGADALMLIFLGTLIFSALAILASIVSYYVVKIFLATLDEIKKWRNER